MTRRSSTRPLAPATGLLSAATHSRALGRLGVRLALAFVAIALAAVGLLAVLTLLATRSEVSELVERQYQDTTASVVAALAFGYDEAGSWRGADLRPAYALAATAGANLEVRDAAGASVPFSGGHMQGLMGSPHGGRPLARGPVGPARTIPVRASGREVGEAILRFPTAEPPAERQVRHALARTVLAGAGLAALLALAVAIIVSARITRPLVRLTRAARRMERGERAARAGSAKAPGELGELSRAFDRMADALAREDALRRDLVADVAHELRTPVTILQAHCEEMMDGIAQPTPDRLSSLHEEVLRLGRLVEDLETLASAEAAGLQLERGRFDLAEIAAEVAGLLAPQFAAAELELVRELESVEVLGDRTRLAQVTSNLLTNALKFTPPGGRVTVQTRHDDSLARLQVRDTGPGIPADELARVFERFWRGQHAKGIGGRGIGLAIVAELVRAHGGRVEAASPPGGGALFSVVLPRA